MPTYTLEMRDGQCSHTVEMDTGDLGVSRGDIHDVIDEWVSDGEWGIDGADIDVWWTLTDEDGDEVDSGSHVVEIEPDHEALIKAAGGDPECDHEWTAKGEGGCDQNPGVWSTGGTSMLFATHCRLCGLKRRKMTCGSQKNPGEHDSVSYEQPDRWCAECESEECECEPG